MDNNTNNIDNSNMTNNATNSGIDPTMLNSIKIPVTTPVAADNTVPAAIPVASVNPETVVVPTTPVVSQVDNSPSLATSVVSSDVTSNLSSVDLEASNFGIETEPKTTPVTTPMNTMNNSSDVFSTKVRVGFCPRCGAEFNPKERYCNKCGNINPQHPDNANMLKYIKKYGGQGYRIGSGQSLVRKKGVFGKGRNSDIVMGQSTGNAAICFAVNIVLYLVLTIGTTLYYLLLARGNVINVIGSNITLYYLVYSAIFLYLYSVQLLFIKLNRRWWLSLIPLVNILVLVEVVNDSKKLMLLSLIPGIGQVIWILTLYRLGTSFKVSGFLTVFCPFIAIPIIAFGGGSFHWLYFVSKNSTIEKDFRYKSVFRTALISFVVLSIVFDLYTQNVKLVNEAGRIDKAYLYNAAHKYAEDVVKQVDAGNYSCDFNMDEFYFHSKDLADDYTLPFSIFFDPVEAYVKVEKVKEDGIILANEYNYYISVSDGKHGFMEISTKDLTLNSITHYERVLPSYDNGNHCYLANKKS